MTSGKRHRKHASESKFAADRRFRLDREEGEPTEETGRKYAKALLSPEAVAWRVINAAENNTAFGEMLATEGVLVELQRTTAALARGDMSQAEAMLLSQARSLEILGTRLIERGLGQSSLPALDAFLRHGLRAMAQSRCAIQALTEIKQGPPIFARQANVSGGAPMQVNNHPPPPSQPRAGDFQKGPSRLSSHDELCADTCPPGGTGGEDPQMAPMGGKHGAENA